MIRAWQCEGAVLSPLYRLSYTLIPSCLQCLWEAGRALSRSITCIKCIVGGETIVYCFSAQLASWWSSLISKEIYGPRLHVVCSSAEMIALISRLGVSRNYGDGISPVAVINDHLTLFVSVCYWVPVLPVTVVFHFLYMVSHTVTHWEPLPSH